MRDLHVSGLLKQILSYFYELDLIKKAQPLGLVTNHVKLSPAPAANRLVFAVSQSIPNQESSHLLRLILPNIPTE